VKLYFSRGACALGPQIVLNELNLKFEMESVNLRDKRTKTGKDFYQINPKGYVPALVLDDGDLLTETNVILQFLADTYAPGELFPKSGTRERYHAQEWLNFIATELHKGFGNIFSADKMGLEDSAKSVLKDYSKSILLKKFEYVDQTLNGRDFLLGKFSVCDAYLFNITSWTKFTGLDLAQLKNLSAYMFRMLERPSVSLAITKEKELT
jgi:glutathione S-transferase